MTATRARARLSGPGSLAFILHHSLFGLAAGLSTQIFPRAFHSDPTIRGCTAAEESACSQGARLAYLAGGLIGAGIGFAGAAAWQFYNWMSESSAYFGLANGIFGAMFAAGFAGLISSGSPGEVDAAAVTWTMWAGGLLGAWLTTIVGGGDLAINKGALMASGAYWATMRTAVVVAIIATTSPGGDIRKGINALMLAPGIGATVMGLALLKFNPSTAQILRADLFGTVAGGVVMLISALVLGAKFNHPVPYILGGVAAAGSIVLVSVLWADAVETPPGATPAPGPATTQPAAPKYRSYW